MDERQVPPAVSQPLYEQSQSWPLNYFETLNFVCDEILANKKGDETDSN